MSQYKAVMVTKKGGPEVLQVVQLDRTEPGPGEVRIAVKATGAGATDLTIRQGNYPFAPPIPLVLGYEAVGVVEALGSGVTSLSVGDRVAALLVHGGYAEELVRPAKEFVKVPSSVSDEDAVALILNYVTAYQAIHRTARVKPGETVLVNAANGGVGTALIALLGLSGAKVYAAAGARHHAILRAMGAVPLEGRAQAADVGLRALLPEGVDVAFDGLGGPHVGQCRRALRRGGRLVGYGFVAAGRGIRTLLSMLTLFLTCFLTGRRPSFYGITMLYRRDPKPFQEDLPKLFTLVAEGRLKPVIAKRLPLLAAREAAELLEAGGFVGKIVHLAAIEPLPSAASART